MKLPILGPIADDTKVVVVSVAEHERAHLVHVTSRPPLDHGEAPRPEGSVRASASATRLLARARPGRLRAHDRAKAAGPHGRDRRARARAETSPDGHASGNREGIEQDISGDVAGTGSSSGSRPPVAAVAAQPSARSSSPSSCNRRPRDVGIARERQRPTRRPPTVKGSRVPANGRSTAAPATSRKRPSRQSTSTSRHWVPSCSTMSNGKVVEQLVGENHIGSVGQV